MSEIRKPRIVIYGTSQFGHYITRFAVQKGWPIVAAFNRAGAKVGQELGRLAGHDRIPDAIAAPPGIVLVSQMGPLKHTALH